MFGLGLLLTGSALTSCEDQPDKYEMTDGVPTIHYIRMADVAVKDSLITGAYMQNTICIVGDNLRSIYKLFFNDQEATLNTSYMTDNTVIVDVPKNIPEVVTNKLYMVTKDQDTVAYDFKVLVPAPVVNAISNEFARANENVTITGDYFLDDPNVPLEIVLPGNQTLPRENITSITKNAVSFNMPANVESGYITVKGIYGNSRSKFYIYDKRNILFDWDGLSGGLASGLGWRDGSKVKHNDGDDAFPSLDGTPYICFSGDLAGDIGASWSEDGFSFNYWPNAGQNELTTVFPRFAEYLEEYGVSGLQIKFEVLVPDTNPWTTCALQMIFSSNDDVTYETATNAFFSSTSVPRGMWIPWKETGSYSTGGKWTTVAVNLSDFNKTHEGNPCDAALDAKHFTGLTFFVWHGGIAGTDGSPVIAIDNIRVVPIEK